MESKAVRDTTNGQENVARRLAEVNAEILFIERALRDQKTPPAKLESVKVPDVVENHSLVLAERWMSSSPAQLESVRLPDVVAELSRVNKEIEEVQESLRPEEEEEEEIDIMTFPPSKRAKISQ